MDVLVVNAGSTSLKLHLVRGDAVESVGDLVPVDAVGHRIVHGGRLDASRLVDTDVIREMSRVAALAPLQNYSALDQIRRVREELPDVPQVAVFDTAFHHTIPAAAATYPLPARWREDWDVHRYGFHGIAIQSVLEQIDAAERIVICHLGGGSSVTAVRDGSSVDTTMGFTPLEGVPMATRSGSIDPGALLYLLRSGLLSVEEAARDLEHSSGVAGLSGGGDGDLRNASPLAVDVFVHRVVGAVAAMAAACGGLDVLAFSGGIGEHADDVRGRIVEGVRFLGDFRVEVVTAREELVIAAETRRVLGA